MNKDSGQDGKECSEIILDSIHSGVLIIDVKTHEIVSVNRRAADMIGLDPETIIGRVCHDFVCPTQVGACPITDKGMQVDSADRVLLKSGGEQTHIQKTVTPIILDGREVLLESFVDITDRKRAEKALRDSETKFHRLYEFSSDAVMLLDEKGFFDCNAAALTLFGCASREELYGKHPAEFSPPIQPEGMDSMTLANQHIGTAIKDGSIRFEWIHRRLDGEDFPAEVLLNAIEMDGRGVLQTVVHDITERKRSEEELRRINEHLEHQTALAFSMAAQASMANTAKSEFLA
ncbi:MAG: PAS domain S-box protein, partial [Deltaproteobacteria bacterium]|nr:PAS domain S-box protein [Deltaproteobacteria bacterium]